MADINADSGYWGDIQDALNSAIAGDSVHVPTGKTNFVNVGEDITIVNIPEGVYLFGAPTVRDSKGMPLSWGTVLNIPWDAPAETLFKVAKTSGTGIPGRASRFSDIKLVGYRSINSSSVIAPSGLSIECIVDFRVDHSYFENICGGGVGESGNLYGNSWVDAPCRGLIDHCFFVNTYGRVESNIADCTVFYGIETGRANGDLWDGNLQNVLGKYTDYTVFIEDCYFEKWRHCIASNSGAHYVFRHNTIKNDYSFGSVDAHGWYQTRCDNPKHGITPNPTAVWNGTAWACGLCGAPLGGDYFYITQVGTRAVELYNNTIIDAIGSPWATFIRGGAGVAFNNTVGGGTYRSFIYLTNDMSYKPEASKVWCHDWYIWNNTMLGGANELIKYDPNNQIVEGRDYFFHAPHTFNYTPYPYPHPLQGVAPATHQLTINSNINGVPFNIRKVI